MYIFLVQVGLWRVAYTFIFKNKDVKAIADNNLSVQGNIVQHRDKKLLYLARIVL